MSRRSQVLGGKEDLISCQPSAFQLSVSAQYCESLLAIAKGMNGDTAKEFLNGLTES
jgi:hypothetical protein